MRQLTFLQIDKCSKYHVRIGIESYYTPASTKPPGHTNTSFPTTCKMCTVNRKAMTEFVPFSLICNKVMKLLSSKCAPIHLCLNATCSICSRARYIHLNTIVVPTSYISFLSNCSTNKYGYVLHFSPYVATERHMGMAWYETTWSTNSILLAQCSKRR